MKHYTLYILAAVLCMLNIQPTSAQQTQDALYIYRNDGGFNAFFYADIDRIEYSKIDTLGVEQPDYVVQEVYALDSLFRIPISAIDSVSFVTPETAYKADVAHTTESDMWKYVIDSDSTSWILLRSDIPSGIIPKVGDKLVTLNQTVLLPAGFTGRVVEVSTVSQGILVTCDGVELTEIFDRYLAKIDAVIEDNGSGARIVKRNSEQPETVSLRIPTLARTFHITKSLDLIPNFTIDGNAYVGFAVTPRLDMRLFLDVGLSTGVNMDIVFRGEMDSQLQFGINGSVTGTFDLPIIKEPIIIPEFPIVKLNIEGGIFAQMQGSLNFGGIYTTTDRLYSLIQFNSLAEGNRQFIAKIENVKDTLEWSDVTGKVTANLGVYAKLSIMDIAEKIFDDGFRYEFGYRNELEAQLKLSDFQFVPIYGLPAELVLQAMKENQEKARTLYDLMNRNVSVNFCDFANLQIYTKYLKKTTTKKDEITFNVMPQGGLVPSIEKPIYRLASAATDSVYLSAKLDRKILLPVKVGFDIYNDRNELVKEVIRDRDYSGKAETLKMGVAGLEAGKKYMAYPRVDFLGYTMYAEPTDSFTTDKPLFEIPQKNLVVTGDPGHTDLKINTNISDIVFSTPDKWLSYIWEEQKQILTIYYDYLPQNQTERKGVIRVVARDGDGSELFKEEISVTQVYAAIELSSTEFKVGVDGGASVITITSSNCKDIEVSTKDNFLHPSVSDKTISVLVDPNTSTESREGIVVVSGTLPAAGLRVERYINFTQAGTMTPEPTRMFKDGSVSITNLQLTPDQEWFSITIPASGGSTAKQGDCLVYSGGDTKVNRRDEDNRDETSWNVKFSVDPKDNNSMRHYELSDGSVTYQKQEYWVTYTGFGENRKKENHQRTTRCSFNVKNLNKANVGGDRIYFEPILEDGKKATRNFLTDFSYEVTEDGKQTTAYGQHNLPDSILASYALQVTLMLEDDIPVLEVSRDTLSFGGDENYQYVSYSKNDVVSSVEVTTSASWITLEGLENDNNSFQVHVPVNNTKEDRTGYVYVTGTLADGSKLTRTVIVNQIYERIWDDEWTTDKDEKAELPSEKILNALRAGGMPLYLGENPPKINTVVKIQPLQLVYSIGDEDAIGEEQADAYYVFSISSLIGSDDSSHKARLRTYTYVPSYDWKSPAEPWLCYLGGDGSHFTLSNITTQKDSNPLGDFELTSIMVISGEISNGSIVNLYYANIFLNDEGGIDELAIIKDGDGLSEPTAWEPGEDIDWDNDGDDDALVRRRQVKNTMNTIRRRIGSN